MMSKIFEFGETHPDYTIPVINEREARAASGLFLFVGLIAFMNAWNMGDFYLTKWVVSSFFIDFTFRMINTRFSPSLIIGRFIVRNQTPEYSGAPQKRFAWAIGFFLSGLMFFTIVLGDVRGPLNMITCLICIIFLFFETAFGICIGCKIYGLFNKETMQLCPGNVCAVKDRHDIQKITPVQIGVLIAALTLIFSVPTLLNLKSDIPAARMGGTSTTSTEERCKVPEFAKKMGHELKWKQHNNCL